MHHQEWLEADGLGGFASGPVCGPRTRRYHALLLTATQPPAGRVVLVNGFEAWLETDDGVLPLNVQHYAPDVVVPEHLARQVSFTTEPWPTWEYRINDAHFVRQELVVPHGSSATVLKWSLRGESHGAVKLHVRPFFSGRDFHALHHENSAFGFQPAEAPERWLWQLYSGLPAVEIRANADYHAENLWYRNFLYAEEQSRGLDSIEDLAAPGVFTFDLTIRPAAMILAAEGHAPNVTQSPLSAERLADELIQQETYRRANFTSPLHRAADAYLVKRGQGKTIIAGYPWFGDWGRDTFIALRGLCLATGWKETARQILLEWAGAVSEGMMPNRFPDHGESPEYNSVDASLWYVIAVYEFLQASPNTHASDRARMVAAVEAILEGYSRGTRHGIHLEDCGLLACGEPGVQLTWMDAKVGDWVVTPRIGKPVEVQALWLNALWIGSQFNLRWTPLFEHGRKAFPVYFWNTERNCLFDVIDCDHTPGAKDASLRPNQIFAVGGLPLNLLEPDQARQVVEITETNLWTSLGLRSLAPGEANYTPRYEGGVLQRDGSYHQGTVWPWLAGPFIEAWVRVNGNNADAKDRALEKFVLPLRCHLQEAGVGHLSEIADAETPHHPRGCPFQAWSLGELLRIETFLHSSSQTP